MRRGIVVALLIVGLAACPGCRENEEQAPQAGAPTALPDAHAAANGLGQVAGPAQSGEQAKPEVAPEPPRVVLAGPSTVIFAAEAGDGDFDRVSSPTIVKDLHLTNSRVTDEGLAHLAGYTELTGLNLNGTKITDDGLVHIERLTGLEELHLTHTGITDTGLRHLERLYRLRFLGIANPGVTDRGLAHLQGLAELEFLDLGYTQVTDEGVASLVPMLPNLRGLYLFNTGVTDAAVVHLRRLPRLGEVDLTGTRVTDHGESELRSALPGCSIKRDREKGTQPPAPADGVPPAEP
jgi:hypothetical protein